MAKENLKISSKGQWSLNEEAPPLKAKIEEKDDPKITKLKALGAKLGAIKDLKSKRPDINWEEKFKHSLAEVCDLMKSLSEGEAKPARWRSSEKKAEALKEKQAEKEKIKQNTKLDRTHQSSIDRADREKRKKIDKWTTANRENWIAGQPQRDKEVKVAEETRRAEKPKMGEVKRNIPDAHMPHPHETEATHRARLQSHFNANPRPGITQQHHDRAISAAWEAGPKSLAKAYANGQWQLLEKATVINAKVPKGSCDCGAHKIGSHAHSDWCGGLKQAATKGFSFKHTHSNDIPANDNYNWPARTSHNWEVFHDGTSIGDLESSESKGEPHEVQGGYVTAPHLVDVSPDDHTSAQDEERTNWHSDATDALQNHIKGIGKMVKMPPYIPPTQKP